MFSIADAQGMFSDNFFAVAFPGSVPVHAKLTTEKIHSKNAAKNVFPRKINRHHFVQFYFINVFVFFFRQSDQRYVLSHNIELFFFFFGKLSYIDRRFLVKS